jgi:hypothetical protein
MKAQEVKMKVDGFEDFENKIKAVQSALDDLVASVRATKDIKLIYTVERNQATSDDLRKEVADLKRQLDEHLEGHLSTDEAADIVAMKIARGMQDAYSREVRKNG